MNMSRSSIPFMDLSWQWKQIAKEALPEIEQLMQTSEFCLGSFVSRFEKAFGEYLGAKHVIGVNSGTSALHLAMICAGVGPGDKVLLPANTFAATAWAVVYVGATPVFCDCDAATANIDLKDAERRCASGVKAIVPVHLFGQPADMDAVNALAKRRGLFVVEDAAQAHGARHGARRAGTIAPMGCFSFYPGKNLGAAGEGGAVVTSDDKLAERLRSLRAHGAGKDRYLHNEVGFNYRMEGMQGLVLWHKLQHLERWTDMRRRLAARYAEGLSELPVRVPHPSGDHVYHLFVIHTQARDALRDFLGERGLATGMHYPVPLHRQPCFSHLQMDRASFPVADRLAKEGLSLPLYPGMTDAEQDAVLSAIRAFFDARRR